MATVIVYNFQVRDGQRGIYVSAKAKCTRETIAAMGSCARIVEGSGEAVDEALLTPSKRYYAANSHSRATASPRPTHAAH